MPAEEIKSGSQVVSEFVKSLQGDETIDVDTLGALRDLFQSGILSKIRLLDALEALRAKPIAQDTGPMSGKDASGDD